MLLVLQVEGWCKEAGKGVTYEFVQWNPYIKNTSPEDPFLKTAKSAVEDM